MNVTLRKIILNEEKIQQEIRERRYELVKNAKKNANNEINSVVPESVNILEDTILTSLQTNLSTSIQDTQETLLSDETSIWSCLDNTQSAICLALNSRQSMLAIGERDGRISIRDNTTIRVVTRELDPTIITTQDIVEKISIDDPLPTLKQVTCIAWSCDSRYIYAGCEVKAKDAENKCRLCVWDVEQMQILSIFSFTGVMNSISAHPFTPHIVLINIQNTKPRLLSIKSREEVVLQGMPFENENIPTGTTTSSKTSVLFTCAKFGTTGKRVYCITSKGMLGVFMANTKNPMELKLGTTISLTVPISFLDMSINYKETALLVTTTKGIYEYSIHEGTLDEVQMYATGSVRAPWLLCTFSRDANEEYVIGLPVVRHRHVGESGIYIWNRQSLIVQHNHGIKDGISCLAWDTIRNAIYVISTIGDVFVYEKEFKTSWAGAMYPAGFRLISDNENYLDMTKEAEQLYLEQDIESKKKKKESGRKSCRVDIFTKDSSDFLFSKRRELDPIVENELIYLPAIPIPQSVLSPTSHQSNEYDFLEESVFKPLNTNVLNGAKSAKTAQANAQRKSKVNMKKRRRGLK